VRLWKPQEAVGRKWTEEKKKREQKGGAQPGQQARIPPDDERTSGGRRWQVVGRSVLLTARLAIERLVTPNVLKKTRSSVFLA